MLLSSGSLHNQPKDIEAPAGVGHWEVVDLGRRVADAIKQGLSCRQPAERFGVSASSAIRWTAEEARQRRGQRGRGATVSRAV